MTLSIISPDHSILLFFDASVSEIGNAHKAVGLGLSTAHPNYTLDAQTPESHFPPSRLSDFHARATHFALNGSVRTTKATVPIPRTFVKIYR